MNTLPPEVLADALQDRIHPTSGQLLAAVRVPSFKGSVGVNEARGIFRLFDSTHRLVADCTSGAALAAASRLLLWGGR